MGAALPLLYALTGATALVYQLAWNRGLVLAFGGTLVTLSAVVACFLAGLALGSIAVGHGIHRQQRPLRLYAALEAAVALFALASPVLVSGLRGLVPPSGAGPARAVLLTALFLLPPTLLMGGTFPALLEAAARRQPGRRAPAVLYGANTVGAVLGVLAAAFFLIPRLGLSRTIRLAALVNLAVALAAAFLSRREAGGEEPARSFPASPAPAASTVRGGENGPILVALALSGFAALIGEVAWTRGLALVLGSSVYAFSLVLASFLFGIGLGSLLYARRSPTGTPGGDLVHYEVRAATACALFAVLLTAAPWLFIFALRAGRGDPAWMAAAAFTVAFGATAYATTALGGAFPAGLAALADRHGPGRAAGRAYAANSVGAVSGALAAGLLFIPRLGLATTLALGVAANLAAAVVASRFDRRFAVAAVAGTALALLFLPAWWRWNQELLVSGVYAYAYRYSGLPAVAPLAPPGAPLDRPDLPAAWPELADVDPAPAPPAALSSSALPGSPGLIFCRDGAHANVAVSRDASGELSLRIDGKTDASTSLRGDMRTQLLLGHLPVLLHRGRPLDALVIGLGSGVTASALARHSLHSIDVVEIEPLVVTAARRYFAAANRAVLDDPRVRIHIADGRNWVAGAVNRYDIVTSEPSNLWMSGVSSLFTREFFEEAARALRQGGVLCQWMHLYQVSLADVQTVLRGIGAVFPHRRLYVDGPDLLVLASEEPLREVAAARPGPGPARELSLVGIAGPRALAALEIGGSDLLQRFAGTGPLHTDDRPLLEFSAPLSLAHDHSAAIVGRLRELARARP